MHKRNLTLSLFGAAALLTGAHCGAAQPRSVSVEMISTFDYPRASYTLTTTGQINDKGTFVGQLLQGTAVLGFTGNANGTFSRPFAEPNDNVGFTFPGGINNGGEVCGRYDGSGGTHGFFRRGTTFRSYDVPVTGASSTTVESVNNASDFVGEYIVSGTGFAYASIGGDFITIPIAGTSPEATGINNLDQVVGTYGDNGTDTFHGFMRATDGTLTFPIDFAGAFQTVPEAINDSGYIVGFWTDRHGAHAFVIQLPDIFVSYDVPGATGTAFTGINSAGLICGNYLDQQHKTHGLIAQLQVQ